MREQALRPLCDPGDLLCVGIAKQGASQGRDHQGQLEEVAGRRPPDPRGEGERRGLLQDNHDPAPRGLPVQVHRRRAVGVRPQLPHGPRRGGQLQQRG